MNAKTGKCCEHCSMEPVGDEGCAYPWYGLAPHTHDFMRTGSVIGSTVIAPRDQWPANFIPDPEADGCGTYDYCPQCRKAEEAE